jgi:hypothetical protein
MAQKGPAGVPNFAFRELERKKKITFPSVKSVSAICRFETTGPWLSQNLRN